MSTLKSITTLERFSIDVNDSTTGLDGNVAVGADTIDAGVNIDANVDGEVYVDLDVDVG